MATLTSTVVDSNGVTLSSTSITILDAKLAAGVNAFAIRRGYQTQIPDVDGNLVNNPENKYDFMIRKMREFAANEINAYLIDAAETAAAKAVTPVSFS
jgi:hypothetical protein